MFGIIAFLNRPVTREIRSLMATVEEIRDQLATQITEVKTSLSEAIDRVAADVQHLQESSDVPDGTFDPVTSGLNDIKTALDALDPLADFPAPEEPAQ